MLRFAANLTMLYNEHPFLDRFSAAAKDGFKAVEYLFPYAWKSTELAERLTDNGLQQALFNAPPGDWDAGERGIACLPGREGEFRAAFARALEYAEVLRCPRVHVMAGLRPDGVPPDELLATYEKNIAWACELAATAGRDVLLEPINQRDMPGYFLSTQPQAHAVVEKLGAANLKVQMDLYHCQIMEGDLTSAIRRWLPTGRVGHFQIASVPLRHEPSDGEVDYRYIFDVLDTVIDELQWEGWIGCEYRPALGAQPDGTSQGLRWLRDLRAERPLKVL